MKPFENCRSAFHEGGPGLSCGPTRFRHAARRVGIALAMVALVFGTGVTAGRASARTLVLHSTGPSAKSYPPGQILDQSKELVLKAGDKLTLLDERGTRQLKGPTILRGQTNVEPRRLNWESLVGSARRQKTGGVRSLKNSLDNSDTVPRPQTSQDHLWDIDPTVPGSWCLVDFKSIRFWRSDPAQEWKMTIEGETRIASLVWPRGRATVEWPNSLPHKPNAKYTIYMPNQPKRLVRLYKIVLGENASELGQSFAANACYQQLSMLLDS